MTRDLSRMGKWDPSELEEWVYMRSLGEKLYDYQHNFMAARFPSPSAATLTSSKNKCAGYAIECPRYLDTIFF